MALVHDLAESIVGDITPFEWVPVLGLSTSCKCRKSGVTKQQKSQMEKNAMLSIIELLGDTANAHVRALFSRLLELVHNRMFGNCGLSTRMVSLKKLKLSKIWINTICWFRVSVK